MLLAAVAGEPKTEEIDGDGKAEQKAARCVAPILLDLAGGVNEEPKQKADDERNVGEGHQTAVFLSSRRFGSTLAKFLS
jgi:hypothetical protein